MTKKLLAILVLSTLCLASQQMPAQESARRVPVKLPVEGKAIFRAQMLGHMVGLDGIITALGEGNYDAAAEIASTELGVPRFQDAAGQDRDQGPGLGIGQYLPVEFRAIARRFRDAANAFAELARSMPDTPLSSEQQQALTAALSKVTNQCRICHDAYSIE